MVDGRWSSADRVVRGDEQVAEIADRPREHPGDGALADAEHVGGDGLRLAHEQQFHEQPGPRLELLDGPVQSRAELRHVEVIGSWWLVAEHGFVEVDDRREAADVALATAVHADNVDRPAAGQHADPRRSRIAGMAAARHERLQAGAIRHAREPADVIEDEADRVVDRARVANPAAVQGLRRCVLHERAHGGEQHLERVVLARLLPPQDEGRDRAERRLGGGHPCAEVSHGVFCPLGSTPALVSTTVRRHAAQSWKRPVLRGKVAQGFAPLVTPDRVLPKKSQGCASPRPRGRIPYGGG
jgi:hypothetical protein